MPQAPGRRTALSGHHWPFLALSGPHASCSLGTTNACDPQAQLPSQGSLKRVFKLLLPILTWRVYSRPSPARCWWNCLPGVDRTPVRVDGCTACLVVAARSSRCASRVLPSTGHAQLPGHSGCSLVTGHDQRRSPSQPDVCAFRSTPGLLYTSLHSDSSAPRRGLSCSKEPWSCRRRQQGGLHQSLGLRLPRGLLATARWTGSHRCTLLPSQVGAAVATATATAFLCELLF